MKSQRTTLYKNNNTIVLVLLLTLLVWRLPAHAQQPWNLDARYPKFETRAVWVTTLSGLDWPRTKATSEEGRLKQQQELCQLLDQLQHCGVNTVLLQTRIRGSVIYPSKIEPWDACLTGQYDRSPGYDPLAFAIEETHRRGMELHAWVVSVPAFKLEVARRMGNRSLLSTHPELLRKHEGMYYLDPALPQSSQYLASICQEIASNYDVDGIHLDYIRYPENAAKFPDGLSYAKTAKGQSKAQWRRDNITRMVRAVHDAVRGVKPWVKLSSSPVGKYKDTRRSSSKGWNCYDAVYQDPKAWLREGLQDMLFPMMYFTGQHFYPFVADWQEDTDGRPVVPGLGIYFLSASEKDWPLTTVSTQLNTLRQEGLGGQAFFRSQFLTDNVKGIYSLLRQTFYACPALPMPTPWLDGEAPTTPSHPSYSMEGGLCRISWHGSTDNTGGDIFYNVYASNQSPVDVDDVSNLVVHHLRDTTFVYNPFKRQYVAVTAMDRCGNESRPLTFDALGANSGLKAERSHFLETKNGMLCLPGQQTQSPSYQITDLSGREVQAGSWAQQIDVSQLRPGIYRLHAMEEKGASKLIGEFLL